MTVPATNFFSQCYILQEKLVNKMAKVSLISKCSFPFYKNNFVFQPAGSLFFPYSQQLEEPIKMGFGGVPLKQHAGKIARKLLKTGTKNALDFFTHAHILLNFHLH